MRPLSAPLDAAAAAGLGETRLAAAAPTPGLGELLPVLAAAAPTRGLGERELAFAFAAAAPTLGLA